MLPEHKKCPRVPEGFGYRYIGNDKVLVQLHGPGGHYHDPRREIEKFNEEMKAKRRGN